MSSAEDLLHPVRLRIIKAFLGDRRLTTAHLSAELGDVPMGSLYRHVGRLTRAGVLEVVAERRVRAAVERTYMLRASVSRIDPARVAAMTVEEHRQAFMVYVAGMLADADRYLASGSVDPFGDGADYQVGAMWLSDPELAELLAALAAVVSPRLANGPASARRRRIMYAVMLPAPESQSGRDPEEQN